ncbi:MULTISPECIES: aspartate carbamoyltransferase catalytic subunit [unclassified Coleofasciculus]|uniref:aspartate carbamoyltransferase catalytic subunit n=1 Tax=Cyanophyceae TaxID=3028117 RepID=UPI0016894A66|nr:MULTISPECIES: aspartate carbamoyltransferase catalytic subunit [unclassified Coleofasciculus]MBD1879976.1 aspartate carbamoyltransferase catalytic subunit [Coleofasciculus sp. FACHB-T130]MBD1901988.1 aspartate carbamoyltransferase catalytic subunit [Coleofasciculus sp. FACHB-125]
MATTTWTRHHVLSLADFTPIEYDTVLQTAASFREVLSRRTKKVPTLQGQVVANLFFESSTRTRSSFELAAKRLSADTLNFAAATSSLTKGETILDTAKTYLAMGADMMVVRHREAGVPQAIAAEMDRLGSKVGVLNAGDGQHEHPSQALLDLFTICTLLDPDHPRLELLKDKKIAIVGDILHSRVARSNIWSLTATGAEVHLAGPPTLLPQLFAAYGTEEGSQGADRPLPSTHDQSPIPNRKLFLHWDLEPALQDADFVMTLRLQKERMTQHLLPSLREYHQRYGITRDRLKLCKADVKVLHPGPVNRGVEISSDLMDDPQFSLISQQVTSGVAVRMALLYLMGGGKV